MIVCGGVPDPQDDHTVRVARFSQGAVLAAKETLIDEDKPELGHVRIRVGFHSGSVVASIVGTTKPKYSLLGDTMVRVKLPLLPVF